MIIPDIWWRRFLNLRKRHIEIDIITEEMQTAFAAGREMALRILEKGERLI